jgi:hypothetical protein
MKTDKRFRHGKCKTPEYRVWCCMIGRCRNPNNTRYSLYGGRGIFVHPQWMNFENFLRDMGNRPSSNHSLSRIDNNDGYTKDNCEWATQKQQMANTSRSIKITMDGETMCLKEWCRRLNIGYSTMLMRIWRGQWNPYRAITTPIRKGNYKRKDK